MINNGVINKAKGELAKLGFGDNINLSIKEVGNDCYVFAFCDENKVYEVRYYDDNKKHLISNYVELEKYGITPFVYMVENSSVVYENDLFYKDLTISDLMDEEIVCNLANFYKRVHEIKCESIDKEIYFSKENLLKIINHFNLTNNECLVYLYNNAENVKLKIKRLQSCFVCSDFSLEYLAVLESGKKIFLKNLDCVKIGNKCDDLNFVCEFLSKENKNKFFDIYGEVRADELILSRVEKVVKDLLLACEEKSFPAWTKSSLELIMNKSFLLDVKCLVEWY